MNNPVLAVKSFLRLLSGGRQPSNLSSRRCAGVFAILAPVLAVFICTTASAQIQVAGQLLIDLNVQRGTLTNVAGSQGMSTTGDPVSLTNWINYGTLGGAFNAINNSAYAATMIAASTNPPEFVTIGPDANGVSATVPYSEDAGGSGVGRMLVASFLTPSQLQGTSPWSVELWFNSSSLLADPRGVFAWTLGAPAAGTDAGEIGGATTAFWAGSAADPNDVTWVPSGVVGTLSTAEPSTGTWHHGVVTYDGVSTMNVYLDGNLSNSVTRTLNIAVENANPVIFSQLNAIPATAASSAYDGSIAALRVHTGVLTLAQVQANFAAGIHAVPSTDNSLYISAAPVTGISGTPGTPNSGTATLNANLLATSDPTTTEVVFFYGSADKGLTTNGWDHYVVLPAPNALGSSPSTILSSLPFSTKYFVRAYAVDAGNTNMSSVVTFTTVGPPIINNGGAFFAGPGSDTVNGNLVSDGDGGNGAWITLYYGTTDGGNNPGAWDGVLQLGPSLAGQSPNFTLNGLAPGSINYFTFEATNIYGATFATPSVSYEEGLIFALNTALLPTATIPPAGAALVTNYPTQAGTFVTRAAGSVPGTPTVQDFGGVPWLSLTANPADHMALPAASYPGGVGNTTSIPISGGSIVQAVWPTGAGSTSGWSIIDDIFLAELGFAMSPTTATLHGGSVVSVTVTSGGTGYATPPTVTFAAPGGIPALDSTATGTAQISSAGVVTNVIITSGGRGYIYAVTGTGNIPPPAVTFSAPTSGTTATGTAVMLTTPGAQLYTAVNINIPNAYGNSVYLPLNQPSIISVVAGSGVTTGAAANATPGDNNFLVYINGVLVEDTAGFTYTGAIGAINRVNNGAGYLTAPAVTLSAPNLPGGVQATATTTLSGTAPAGHILRFNIVNAGSGYTSPPTVTVAAPPAGGTQCTGAAVLAATPSPGNGPVVPAAGYNGGGMTQLLDSEYGVFTSVFDVGSEVPDPWSGFQGYLGNAYFYGEAISPAKRQALEAQLAGAFITGATESFTITASVSSGSGTVTPAGATSAVQGFPATYTITPTPGYSISSVLVDGVSVGIPTSYIFTNVSAAHTISAAFVAVPVQNVTVSITGGTGGSVNPNGAVTGIPGGSNPFFSIQPSNGFVLSSVVVDGTTIAHPAGTTPYNGVLGAANPGYTFVNIGVAAGGGLTSPNHTLAVTFTALGSFIGPFVPKSDQLIFALDTSGLPQSSGTAIPYWPVYAPATLDATNTLPGFEIAQGTPKTIIDANGTLWEQNIEIEDGATQTSFTLGPKTGTTVPSILTPNGITIVLACQPQSSPPDNNRGDIVAVGYNNLAFGVRGSDEAIVVIENGTQIATPYTIPSGTNVVLSLVIQPAGGYAVYANTIQVYTNAGNGPFTKLFNHVNQSYGNNINLGNDGASGGASGATDTWPDFNGYIGDVFFYATALTNGDRLSLETNLMTQFHATAVPSYNWVGPSGGNWSDINNWSNTLPFAINTIPGTSAGDVPLFSLSSAVPLPGLTVNLDVPEQINGLTFNSSTIISSTDGGALTLGDGTKTGSITISNAASPQLQVPLTLDGALTINGLGTLTLTANVTLNGANGRLAIAPTTSSTNAVIQTGGTITTVPVATGWFDGNGTIAAGFGPGVILGCGDDTATSATYSLNGGTLITPNIGCVADASAGANGPLQAPSTHGATAILNLNGGVLQAAASDSSEAGGTVFEGSDHLIFNTTHTWVQAGGAIINTAGFSDSIAVPLEHYPNGPIIDGGLTLMGGGILTNLLASTYTGPTTIQAGILAEETATSLGVNTVTIGAAPGSGAQLQLDFTGTATVYQLIIGGTVMPAGVYGSSLASGLTTAPDNTDFAGTGSLTVLGTVAASGATPTFTSMGVTGNLSAGTGVLNLQGTGGILGTTYAVLTSANVAAPLSTWTTLTTGTFTTAGFSISTPITSAPQAYITIVVQ